MENNHGPGRKASDDAPGTDSAASGRDETDSSPTVLVALSNPRTESALVTLAGVLATQRGGSVLAIHVVRVPDQTALEAAVENERLGAESERLLEAAKRDAESIGVETETRTILSHRGIEEVFDAARRTDASAVLMGYGGARFLGGRVENPIEELANSLPCDFLVLNDRGFDPSRVLLPTAGGYSSSLSAEVARALRDILGADVSVLYVAEDGDIEAGREFITDWALEHRLTDADMLVESGDIEAAIERNATDHSLVVIGATGRGLLARVVGGSLTFSVLENLDVSVLVAERPSDRSILERLFGR
jgi:nucleotide-binding universal stress UspA family protein